MDMSVAARLSRRAPSRLASGLAVALLAAGLALAAPAPAHAQSRCKVTDPTGTPLNVRTGPEGKVIGTVRNGALVRVLDTARDAKGRPWVYVSVHGTGQPLGWVFREFISCY